MSDPGHGTEPSNGESVRYPGGGDPAAACDILVVDDSQANLIAVEATLGDLGRQLAKVSSGAEALKQVLTRDFALILMDVEMPGMDGFETARLIRSRPRSRHVPIIFLTAHDRDSSEVLKGYELGAVDFLFKPLVPEVLSAKAAVFVELQRRAAELVRQQELLREHERREQTRKLEEERQRWEAILLQQKMQQQRRVADQLAERAEELARAVTELERAEGELRRVNEHLGELDRRKDEFIAMLAHELRNPLAPLVNGLELMRQLQGDEPQVATVRDAMERQVAHLIRLVDDLLDVSRINSGKIELRKVLVELKAIVEQAVATSRCELTEREHHFDLQLPEEPIWMRADGVRLAQVLANLLNNAARYTPAGGKITVRCERRGNQAEISVVDNGQGIAPELMDRIFDMFVQRRNGGRGLGVGLTLVRRLVELHGGSVQARSAGEGQGSQFHVTLPVLSDAEVETQGQAKPPPSSELRKNERLSVVVIEDDEDIRETLSLLLESWGHEAEGAGDGEQGISLVLRKRPRVALVDIGLPGTDGYQVAQRLRERFDRTALRLVAMTGYGQAADRVRALKAGFDAHLVKPASADDIRRALHDIEQDSTISSSDTDNRERAWCKPNQ